MQRAAKLETTSGPMKTLVDAIPVEPAIPSNSESCERAEELVNRTQPAQKNRVLYETILADTRPRPEPPRLAAAPQSAEKKAVKPGKTFPLLKTALLVGAISLTAVGVFRPAPAEAPESLETAETDGLSPADANLISDSRNWTTAKPSELNPYFTDWLRGYGVDAAAKIEVYATRSGEPSGAAYLLATAKSPRIKRVVWIVDQQVVYDNAGEFQGIAKVSKEGMSRVVWSESGTPAESAEGEGLLVVREYTNPRGTTLFFMKDGKLCSGIPANITNLDLK